MNSILWIKWWGRGIEKIGRGGKWLEIFVRISFPKSLNLWTFPLDVGHGSPAASPETIDGTVPALLIWCLVSQSRLEYTEETHQNTGRTWELYANVLTLDPESQCCNPEVLLNHWICRSKASLSNVSVPILYHVFKEYIFPLLLKLSNFK